MDITYNPFDPVIRSDPFPYYRQLRAHAPVHFCPEADIWVIAGFDDVSFALNAPDVFSSDGMRTMMLGIRPGADPLQDPESLARLMEMTEALPFSVEELAEVRNLISLDPPVHDLMRKLVNRGFTPRRIEAWKVRVEAVVAEAMKGITQAREFDLVSALTIPVPVIIIAEMLGVDPVHYELFKRWSDEIIAGATGSGRSNTSMDEGYKNALGDFAAYFQTITDSRRQDPLDDLVSVLVQAKEGNVGLTDPEIVFFALLLLVAGNETTTNLIGNAVRALLAHPDQLERVHEDRSLIPAVLDETLRYDGPVQFVFRRATRDVEIGGVTIPRNALVLPLIGSANRDERCFDDPDVFDISRESQGHIAFGYGIHYCLGAALARLEGTAMLDGLLDVLPRLRQKNEHVDFVDSYLVRGPTSLVLQAR